MRQFPFFGSVHFLAYGACASFFFFAPEPLAAQSQEQTSFEEFQRRMEVCQSTETWLRTSCMQSVYNLLTQPASVAPATQTPNTPPVATSPAIDPRAFTELHMVGIYEAPMATNIDGTLERAQVAVQVNRPGERVALALSSYDPVVWNVTASPGTTIVRIGIGGQDVERSAAFLDGTAYDAEILGGSNSYKTEGERFHPYYNAIRKAFGTDKAASFNGAYEAPATGFVIADAPGLPTQKEEQAAWDAARLPKEQLPPPYQQAFEHGGQTGLKFGEKGFNGTLPDGSAVNIPLTIDMPDVSHPVGSTYDAQGQRLWGVTLGGKGVLYAYDMQAKTWQAYSMNNVDVGGIHYDPQTDSIYTSPGMTHSSFMRLDTKGAVVEQYNVPMKAFLGLDRLYDPGNGPEPSMRILAANNDVLLVEAQPNFSRSKADKRFHYLVNLRTNQVDLIR